jgi:hypothetical protein
MLLSTFACNLHSFSAMLDGEENTAKESDSEVEYR